MIVFENVRTICFEPPSVSEPVDVAVTQASDSKDGKARIAEVGKGLASKYPGARRIQGAYLSPGLVCAHTHLYSALARGMLVNIEPSKDFADQLKHLWWRLDMAIDLPILEASALVGCAEAALCGVTSLVDHHAGPAAIDGSLSVIRKAYEQVGLRGILCYETTERNGMLEEFRFACFRHRESGGPWWPGDFLKCLDRGNRLIERYFSESSGLSAFGKIEAGAAADLVLWDYDPPTPLVGENVAGHLAFGLSSRSVQSVMVDGDFIVEDRQPCFDAEAIGRAARSEASRLWSRMNES